MWVLPPKAGQAIRQLKINYILMKKLVLIVGAMLLIAYGCIKVEPVSIVPHITFKGFKLFEAIDTSLGNHILRGVLEFSFIDGDADIGMDGAIDTADINSENNYNLFFIPYQKIGSNYYPIELDTLLPKPYYRIDHNIKMDRVGQNKTLKGTISVNIDYYLVPQYDTIRYDFYILDRAKNKSNIESTTDIGFKGITLSNSY
jgi:hypothetical protein